MTRTRFRLSLAAAAFLAAAPARAGAPLGSLADGLRTCLPFDGSLSSVAPSGVERQASFDRGSVAFTPDMRKVGLHVPRFLDGRFGRGILVEYGVSASSAQGSTNHLPAAVAEARLEPGAFEPVGGAVLSRSGDAIEGTGSLSVRVSAAGQGFATAPAALPLFETQIFSLYVKGPAGTSATVAALCGRDGPVLASGTAVLDGRWQRVSVAYAVTAKTIPPDLWKAGAATTPPLVFAVTTDRPGTFLADALMAEVDQGYGRRPSPSGWMPAGRGRAGEILWIPPAENPDEWTIAFRARLLGGLKWRCLLCIGNDVGWYPDLRLDVRENRRIELTLPDKKGGAAVLSARIEEGEWRHYAVTWKGKRCVVYLDGNAVIVVEDAPRRPRPGRINIGGVAVNFSPALRADAVFDDFGEWTRALAPEEALLLAGRTEPLSAGIAPGFTIEDREPVAVVPRDYRSREWPFRIRNRGPRALSGVAVTAGIEGVFRTGTRLPAVPAGGTADCRIVWEPARILPGAYRMDFSFSADGTTRRCSRTVEVVAARPPASNAQVIAWGGFGAAEREAGVTVGGITGTSFGPLPHEVEDAVRNGLYCQLRQGLTGDDGGPDDRFLDAAGRPAGVDQSSPSVRGEIDGKIARLAENLALHPDVRHMIVNTEHQWIWTMDFRPSAIESAKKRFGLDLTPWTGKPASETWRLVHPGGRLSARAGGIPLPADGIVGLSHPFYAYHRWWHGPDSGTEVFLNDAIARGVRKTAPWVKSINEPVLRRPAVRAFREGDIAEEWYYYPNPNVGIWVQEALAAAARNTRAAVTGMPQFLLKPGMAAPYAGMPTPDMFRETVWHCISRPLAGLTYWNLWSALARGKDTQTQEEVDARFGVAPKAADVKSKIKVQGESSEIFLWIPELKDEIARIHNEVVHPLGALLPAWRNAPRRLAVHRSFAGQLFNEVRWSGNSPVERLVEALQQPFDILYDQDFEENPALLSGCRVLAIPESPVLTEPAARQIREFVARGGTVLADEMFAAKIDGVRRIAGADIAQAAGSLPALEEELLAKYGRPDHPLFIEAMEQAAREGAAEDPLARTVSAVLAALKPETRTPTRHVHFNVLTTHGAAYLAAVNDLRVHGRHYGHFGLKDKGVAQTAVFEMEKAPGAAAYEIPAKRRVPVSVVGDRASVRLTLPPAGGSVLVFLPAEIGRAEMAPARPDGGKVSFAARLLDVAGRTVPGIIPARAAVSGPDGTASDFSHYGAFVDGAWTFDLPVPFNGPAGNWTVEITDLAAGKTARAVWRDPGRRAAAEER